LLNNLTTYIGDIEMKDIEFKQKNFEDCLPILLKRVDIQSKKKIVKNKEGIK